MRRLVASSFLLLLAGSVFALPAAAAFTPRVHTCCRAEGRHHCMATSGSISFNAPQQRCPHSQSLNVPYAPARPQPPRAASNSPEAHPFLMEFLPAPLTPENVSRESQRAPPLTGASR
jgi:hypothetical protein